MNGCLVLIMVHLAATSAQKVGTAVQEQHPQMPLWTCTLAGCSQETKSLTIDSNWRWVHNADYTNCYMDSSWNPLLCPDPLTCSANCQLEGISASQYENTLGVDTMEDGIELKFATETVYGANYGSRLYMMESEKAYEMFKLKNREFSMTVDVMRLPCGLNGAVYFVEMDADGGIGRSQGTNQAGAKYGTGYCDAQCPRDLKFINGEANLGGWNSSAATPTGLYGSCCNEMDIWEANSRSSSYTAHPCNLSTGLYRCKDSDCDKCDRAGCDFNSYRLGDTWYFGRGSDFAVDTKREFTVVTQFITEDGTDTGDLIDIRRFYVQDGKLIPNSNASIGGLNGSSVTDAFCDEMNAVFGDVNYFASKGGLKVMGEALDRGMVLAFSLWDDAQANMLWLDAAYPTTANITLPGVSRGPCNQDSGSPEYVRSKYPDASVKFSDVKVGSIGSTQNTSGCVNPQEGDRFGGNRRLMDTHV